jgi:hypothetical protein
MIFLETSSYVELEEYVEEALKIEALDKSIFLNHIEKINYAISDLFINEAVNNEEGRGKSKKRRMKDKELVVGHLNP